MQEMNWRRERYLGSRSGKAIRLYGTYVRYALYKDKYIFMQQGEDAFIWDDDNIAEMLSQIDDQDDENANSGLSW